MESMLGRLVGFCQVVMDVVLLSIAWLCGVVVGVVVAGVAPASCALVGAARMRFVDQDGHSVWTLFWRLYRKWFKWSSQVLGSTLVILAFVIADYALVRHLMTGMARDVFAVFFGFLIVIVGLTLIHQIRAFATDGEVRFLEGLTATWRRPLHNLAYATITFALIRIGVSVYGFFLLLGPGLWAWLVTIIGQRLDRVSR